MKKVIFICTGNTCRSPMAQGLFAAYLAQRNVEDIAVDSAGIFAVDGESASGQAVRAVKAFGVDLAGHEAKKLSEHDVCADDILVAMTRDHADMARLVCPQCRHVLTLSTEDISDPYGGSQEVYDACAEEIWAKLPALYERVRQR